MTDQNNLVPDAPPTSISAKLYQLPYPSTLKLNTEFRSNSDLFEDFMDTHFRSSIDQQIVSPNHSNKTYTFDTISDSNVDKTALDGSD